jgi:hypothetical protein
LGLGLRGPFPQPASPYLASFVGACSTPYAQSLVALDSEIKACFLDRALGAHGLGFLETCVVIAAEEEIRVGEIATERLALPRFRSLNNQRGHL